MLRACLLLALTVSFAECDITALKKVSAAMAKEGETEAALVASIAELTRAEQACSADGDGAAEGRVISHVREGYSKLLELGFRVKPVDSADLAKRLAKANKKKGAAEVEANDDEVLMSKAEKAERAAVLAKATKLVAKLEAKQQEARASAAVAEPRNPVTFPRLAAIKSRLAVPSSASVQVLSTSPMVVVVDNWLGEHATTALNQLPVAFERALSPPTPDSAQAPSPNALPTNASELNTAPGAYDRADPQAPALCLPYDNGAIAPAYLAAVDAAVAAAKAGSAAEASGACLATAGITDDAPPEWDAEDDGEWKGEFNSVSDRFVGGCGPLTPALDAAMVQSDSVYFTASAESHVDVLDFAVSGALGYFPIQTESLAHAILSGLKAGPDTSASAPEDWDEEEDGPWAAPLLEAQTPTALLAKIVTASDTNASALGDAYTFSSSPELLRLRASNKGGEALHHECNDFSKGATSPNAALVAYVHASEAAAASGGEISVPAAGVSVSPQRGRLILVETSLPSGACDPAAAIAAKPLDAASGRDLLLLRKTYYVDRSWSREGGNREGPRRGTPRVLCEPDTHGCRRFEHVPAEQGDAVLPLRDVKAKRECLPPGADGACFDANYVPPPPPPKKKKKTPPPPPPPEAAAATPSPPTQPAGPQAPPPVNL